MSDGVIYECPRGCTVALDDCATIPDESILLPISGLSIPECEECPNRMEYLAILDPAGNPSETAPLCRFSRNHRSHRNLVPHVCTCKPIPQPEPAPAPESVLLSEPTSQAPIVDKQAAANNVPVTPSTTWTDEEVDTIKVCGTAEDACVRYADTHPGQRNSNAVTQKWMKIQRRGGLLQIGKNCVISDTASVNAGKTAKVISFCEGKHVANVEVIGEALSTYQYDVHQLTGATL